MQKYLITNISTNFLPASCQSLAEATKSNWLQKKSAALWLERSRFAIFCCSEAGTPYPSQKPLFYICTFGRGRLSFAMATIDVIQNIFTKSFHIID